MKDWKREFLWVISRANCSFPWSSGKTLPLIFFFLHFLLRRFLRFTLGHKSHFLSLYTLFFPSSYFCRLFSAIHLSPSPPFINSVFRSKLHSLTSSLIILGTSELDKEIRVTWGTVHTFLLQTRLINSLFESFPSAASLLASIVQLLAN